MKVFSETEVNSKNIDAEEREMMVSIITCFVLHFAMSLRPDVQKSDLRANNSEDDYSYHKMYFPL